MVITKKSGFLTTCCSSLLFIFLHVAVGCLYTDAASPSDPKNPLKTIKVVMDNNYPPYVFLDDKGNLVGILIDQWRLWEQKTGIKANIYGVDWGEAQSRMRAGEFDVIDTIFFNENRAKIYDFSKPYAKMDVSIFFHKDISGISNVDSLQGFTVAVKSGDNAIDHLRGKGIKLFQEYPSYEAIIRAAKEQKVMVAVIDKPPALYFLYKMGILDQFRYSAPLYTGEFHRAVMKGNTAILKSVEEGFLQISESEYQAINRTWFGTETSVFHPYLRSIGTVLGGLIFIVLLLIVWNRTLRKKVHARTLRLEEEIALNIKKTEALQLSEEKYRELVENANSIIMRMDKVGRITFLNEFAQRFFGFREEDIIGRNVVGTIVPVQETTGRDLANIIADIGRNPDMYVTNENENMRINGERVWIAWTNKPIFDPNDNISEILCVGNDITDRKRAEEALRESEERLSKAQKISHLGSWEFDLSTNRLIWSDEVYRIFGFQPRESAVTHEVFLDLTHPDDRAAVNAAYSNSLREGRDTYEIEHRVVRKHTQDVRYVYQKCEHVRDTSGRVVRSMGLVQDITDRKHAEEVKRSLEDRLNRAEKMEALGQLAGGVAHDLNNVLGILSGYSELLLLEIPEGQKSRGHAEKILQSTERGAAIIQDLLTLARRGVTVSDVINLNSIVSSFLTTPVFEKIKDYHPRVTFRIDCDDNLLNIKGSPVHLEKTLMNLVSNAAESISGKGEVTIQTESRYLEKALRGYDEVNQGDYTVLTVSDTGKGIAAENIEKIFEPFYTKKAMGRSGTGLGLAIVWGAVKDHHGYIDVQTKVGEGTTFTLYFPVTREEMIAPQQKEPIERYMGKGESVLVVDDIAEQRDIASRLLTRLGYEVHVVASGEEAVEYLKGNKADILVLDMIMLPGIDGLETYQRVLKVNPKQKAILVSGFSETDRVKEAQKLGAGAYVKKPYVTEKIGVAIRDELNR